MMRLLEDLLQGCGQGDFLACCGVDGYVHYGDKPYCLAASFKCMVEGKRACAKLYFLDRAIEQVTDLQGSEVLGSDMPNRHEELSILYNFF